MLFRFTGKTGCVISFHISCAITQLLSMHYSFKWEFFFLVGAITTSQFFVGNSSKLQTIGPLCQEEAKHCIVDRLYEAV